MSTLDSRPYAAIARTLFPGSQLRRAWPLTGGISADMTALAIETASGRQKRLVVRRHAHAAVAQSEFRLLQLTAGAGLPAPQPYHLDLSATILLEPYLVISYSEGEMNFAPVHPDNHWRQLAAGLAQIHSMTAAAYDLSFLPASGEVCHELARTPGPDVGLREPRIRAALATVAPPVARNAPVLLHGDYWPGNTLWQNGRLVAIIDWEDAAVGDPLLDFARSRAEMSWIFGPAASAAFSTYYRTLVTLDETDLPYWDLCAALRMSRLASGDLAGLAAYFADYGRNDITAATIRRDLNSFVDRALAAL